MATANYVLLEKITVGAGGASSVTFSGIPQTGYTDLVLKGSVRTTQAAQYGIVTIQPNGSSTNISGFRIYGGDGGAYSDNTPTVAIISGSSATSDTFGSFETYIPNYTGSNYKSYSSDSTGESNSTTNTYMALTATFWYNTSAITSLQIMPNAVGFVANSTFYLYGVAKLGTTPAIVPYATGGDTIMTDGTYWYHTFVSSGTFTPQKALSCDYLVVAGGGGGGANAGGGGGAGGLRSTVTATGGGGSLESALSLSASTNYTVTIGAGGTRGSTNGSTTPTNGSNSVFGSITSTGGGYGINPNASGIAGGSGGGAAGSGSQTGGAGTSNQGYAGGGSSFGFVAGGGGGAGAVGGSSSSGVSGNGGAGVATSISGTSVTYAGGGGGGLESSGTAGTGGAGGGGNGSGANGNGVAGTSNTGGGGGGGSNGGAVFGGNGGSGIVIVRYPV